MKTIYLLSNEMTIASMGYSGNRRWSAVSPKTTPAIKWEHERLPLLKPAWLYTHTLAQPFPRAATRAEYRFFFSNKQPFPFSKYPFFAEKPLFRCSLETSEQKFLIGEFSLGASERKFLIGEFSLEAFEQKFFIGGSSPHTGRENLSLEEVLPTLGEKIFHWRKFFPTLGEKIFHWRKFFPTLGEKIFHWRKFSPTLGEKIFHWRKFSPTLGEKIFHWRKFAWSPGKMRTRFKTLLEWVHFKLSFFVNALRATAMQVIHCSTDINALRATAMQVIHCSTDINALRATVSRREIISVEKTTHIPAFVRRTLTGDNLKCTCWNCRKKLYNK